MAIKKIKREILGQDEPEDFEWEPFEYQAVRELRSEVTAMRKRVSNLQLDHPLHDLLKCVENRLREIIARGKGTVNGDF